MAEPTLPPSLEDLQKGTGTLPPSLADLSVGVKKKEEDPLSLAARHGEEYLTQSSDGNGTNFDPEGTGYDEATAKRFNLKPDETGHWQSRVELPKEELQALGLPEGSGIILKGRGHPTFDKTINGEDQAGYQIIKKGSRYYSVPKDNQEVSIGDPVKWLQDNAVLPDPPSSTKRIMYDASSRGDYAGSDALAQSILTLNPNDAYARRIAYYNAKKQNKPDAPALLDLAMQVNPDDPTLIADKATLSINAGDFGNALMFADRLEKIPIPKDQEGSLTAMKLKQTGLRVKAKALEMLATEENIATGPRRQEADRAVQQMVDWDDRVKSEENAWYRKPGPFSYVMSGVSESLLGMALRSGIPKGALDEEYDPFAGYEPSNAEIFGRGFVGLLADTPFFSVGAKPMAMLAERGIGALVSRQGEKYMAELLAEGMTKTEARQVIAHLATQTSAKLLPNITRASASMAGSLGVYGAAQKTLEQLADPNVGMEDIRWSEVLDKGWKDFVLGAAVGPVGATAGQLAGEYGKLVEKGMLPGWVGRPSQAVITGAGFTTEVGVFTVGGALVEGRSLNDITNEEFVMNALPLLGLRIPKILKAGANQVIKWTRSKDFKPSHFNSGVYRVTLAPEEISNIYYNYKPEPGEGPLPTSDEIIRSLNEDPEGLLFVLKNPSVTMETKAKLLYAIKGVMPDALPTPARIDTKQVGDKAVVMAYNEQGEVIFANRYDKYNEAQDEAMKLAAQIVERENRKRSSGLTIEQKLNIAKQLRSTNFDFNSLYTAMDKVFEPWMRTPEENKAINKFDDLVAAEVKKAEKQKEQQPVEVKDDSGVAETMAKEPESILKPTDYEYQDNTDGTGLLRSRDGRKTIDPATVTGASQATAQGERVLPGSQATLKVGQGVVYDQRGYRVEKIEDGKVTITGNGQSLEVEPEKVLTIGPTVKLPLGVFLEQPTRELVVDQVDDNELKQEAKLRINKQNVDVLESEAAAIADRALEMAADPLNAGKKFSQVMDEAVEEYRQFRAEDSDAFPDLEMEINRKAPGSETTSPSVNLNEAVRNSPKNTGKNLWVRQSQDADNSDRLLLVQCSNNFLNLAKADTGNKMEHYFDKLYRLRKGYSRTFDFWEIPMWMARIARIAPKSDVYVIRDINEAIDFMAKSGYKNIAFSVMDINEPHVLKIADALPNQKFSIGGYKEVWDKWNSRPNVTRYESISQFAQQHGYEDIHGYDYRHFHGSRIIARIRMSEGCLHKCAFCGGIPRKITEVPKEVIDEQVQSIADLDAQYVYIDDKTFGQASNYTYLAEMYEKIKASNPEFQGFIIQTTAGQMLKFTDDFIQASHIKYVELGIESYNDPILKRLHKPANEKTMDKAVEKIRQNKINFVPNIVIGFHGVENGPNGKVHWEETEETYNHTLDFLKRNADAISHVNLTTLALYEGTELADGIDNRVGLDISQNIVKKSYHLNPQVHEDAMNRITEFGETMLDKKPLSEVAIEEKPIQAVFVAPYRSLTLADPAEAAAIRQRPEYKEYIKNLHSLAGKMGITINTIDESVGLFEGGAEVSNRLNITARNLDHAEYYAAVIGVLAHEAQKATIAAQYVDWESPNQNAIEHEFRVADTKLALDLLKAAGITDATLNESTGKIEIVDPDNDTNLEFNEKLRTFVVKLEEHGYKPEDVEHHAIDSRYVDADRRTELLGNLKRQEEQSQGRTDLYQTYREAAEKDAAYRRENGLPDLTLPEKVPPEALNIHEEFNRILHEKDALYHDLPPDHTERVASALADLNSRAPGALPIEVVANQADLPEVIQDEIRSQSKKGKMFLISAATDNLAGKIYFVASNIRNVDEALTKWIHEQGVHRGLRNLIVNTEDLDKLLLQVFDSVGEQKIRETLNETYVASYEKGTLSKARFAEEYLADLATKIVDKAELTAAEKGLWQQFVQFVRDAIYRLIGRDVPLTDGQIADIVKASVGTLYEKPTAQTTGEGTMLSAVAILKGKERISGRTKREIYEELNQRSIDKYGKIGRVESLKGKEGRVLEKAIEQNKTIRRQTVQKASGWIAEEVKFMQENRPEGSSGIGWYTKEWKKALRSMSAVFPELATDKSASELFTLLTAITSDGTDVRLNAAIAADLYKAYKDDATGFIPHTTKGGERSESYNKNIDRINDLISENDGDIRKAVRSLLKVQTGEALREQAKQQGTTFSSGWADEIELPVAASVLGPKLGIYFANLMGMEGFPTLDRWFSRSFNRYRGTGVPEVRGLEGKGGAVNAVGLKRFKITMGDPEMSDVDALYEVADRAKRFAKRTGPEGEGHYWTELERRIGFKESEDGARFWQAVDDYGVRKGENLFPEMEADKELLVKEHLADKQANTLNKMANTETVDAPLNADDRTMMFDTLKAAQKKLVKQGINLTISDIQAALWYFEKELYVAAGGNARALGVSYGDVAPMLVERFKSSGSFFSTAKEDIGKVRAQEAKDRVAGQQRLMLSAEEVDVPYYFRNSNEKPIGWEYDTDRVARDRFDIPALFRMGPLGGGSDRDVYDLGNDMVLKVAKTARGLAQNAAEGDFYLVGEGLVPNYYERGLNYLVCEKAEQLAERPTTKEEREKKIGMGPTYEFTTGNKQVDHILSTLKKFNQGDFDKKTPEIQEAFDKLGLSALLSYDLLFGDIAYSPENWGILRGKPVIVDGGTMAGTDFIDDYFRVSHTGDLSDELSDADFAEVYERTQIAKKDYGDKKDYLLYAKQQAQHSRLIEALKGAVDKYKQAYPDLNKDQLADVVKRNFAKTNPEITEDQLNEALGIPKPKIRPVTPADFETALKNATVENEKAGREGINAFEHMKSALKSTDLDMQTAVIREGISRGSIQPEQVTQRVIRDNTGSLDDEMTLLIHRALLYNEEIDIQQRMSKAETDEEKRQLNESLGEVYAKMSDNDMAAAILGREASLIFLLRQRYMDGEFSLSAMRREYMATKNLSSLTQEEQEFVRTKFQELKDLREKLEKKEARQAKRRQEKEIMNTLETEGGSKPEGKKKGPKNSRDRIEDARARLKELAASGVHFSMENVYLSAETDPLNEVSRAITDISREIVRDGVKDFDEVVKRTLSEIQDIVPHFKEEDVIRHLSGYARDHAPRTRSELAQDLSNVKKEAKLRIDLQDELEGNVRLKIGYPKVEDTPQIKALKEEIKKAKEAKKPPKPEPLTKEEKAEQAELKRKEKLLERLTAINEGRPIPKRLTIRKDDSPEVKALKDEIDRRSDELGISAREYNQRRIDYLKKRKALIEEKRKNKDYSSMTKIAKVYEKSDELVEAERAYAMAVNDWKSERAADQKKNRPLLAKMADWMLRWQRFAVLSYGSTLLKLAAVVGHSLVLKPIMTAAQEIAYHLMPNGIAKKADLWGEVHWSAVGKYYSEVIRNFAWERLKNQFRGKDDKEIQYGDPHIYEEWSLAKGLTEFPGRTHGWIKSFIKNAEFEYAHQTLTLNMMEAARKLDQQLQDPDLSEVERKRLTEEMKAVDPTRKDVQLKINKMSVEHGKWSILMNENGFVQRMRGLMDNTGIFGVALRSELPILRIPTNYVDRALTFKYGIIPALIGKRKLFSRDWELEAPGAISLIWNGTSQLNRQQSDILMRSTILGSLGVSFFTLGYFLRHYITHKEDGSYDVKVGDNTINLPKNTLHIPLYESILSGAGTGHMVDKLRQKGDSVDAMDWIASYVQQDIDMVKRMPFTNMLQYGATGKLIDLMYSKDTTDRKWNKAATVMTQKMVDMIDPGWVKEVAKKQADKEGEKRYPNTPLEVVLASFPWLRQQVPTQDSLEMRKRQEKLDKKAMGKTPEQMLRDEERKAQRQFLADSLEDLMRQRIEKRGGTYIPPVK